MLSKTILNKSIECDNEKGWRLKDIPAVAYNALKNDIAILGGQIQYKFPDGTCELYWINVDTDRKNPNESWKKYVKRNYNEFLLKFKENVLLKDINKEAIESFSFIKKKAKEGVDINKYQVFILYFLSEDKSSQ